MHKLPLILVTALVAADCVGATSAAPASGATDMPADPVESTFDWRSERPSAGQFSTLLAQARNDGGVRVIVGLRVNWTADALLSSAGRSRQRAELAAARDRLLGTLTGHRHRVVGAYRTLPLVALDLSPSGVQALEHGGRAATVRIDRRNALDLAQSVPLVEAGETASLGFGGGGETIAVLDTGVDGNHPFLTGRLTGGCFATVFISCLDLTSGLQFAGPCSYSILCQHGTHVAGIAAGRNGSFNGTVFSGVAPDASIVSMKVFERDDSDAECQKFYGVAAPCPTAWDSVVLAALDAVALNSQYHFAAVNLSLGSGTYANPCPESPYAPAVAELLSQGVATVAAAGNDGSKPGGKTGISSTACVPGAVGVGATTTGDVVDSGSQSSPSLSLLAPGVNIVSSYSGSYQALSGTSMAAPHVAGAFAVLKQRLPNTDVATLLGALQATGKPVKDDANGQITPRLRLLTALVRLGDTGLRTQYSNLLPGGKIVSQGTGVRLGGGTITIDTIPTGAVVKRAYLFFMTVRGSDSDARVGFNGTPVVAELVGASRDPCTAADGSAVRVYRASVTALVNGNGSYAVSGIGGSGMGEGVSLVALIAQPGAQDRGVQIRAGAITGLAGETMTHTFAPLVPVLTDPELNVGMGAGDGGTEGPMTLGSTSAFIANAFGAFDGPWWDDHHVHPKAPASLLSPVNGIHAETDCLAWAYAALSYAG